MKQVIIACVLFIAVVFQADANTVSFIDKMPVSVKISDPKPATNAVNPAKSAEVLYAWFFMARRLLAPVCWRTRSNH